MMLRIFCTLLVALVHVQGQYLNPYYYPSHPFFRDGLRDDVDFLPAAPRYPAELYQQRSDARFFFSTITYTWSTTTTTRTFTSMTTCTTSTATLSTCTPGRRRRMANNRLARGLFYDEEEEFDEDLSSIFLPSLPSATSSGVEKTKREEHQLRERVKNRPSSSFTGAIFTPEPGHPLPEYLSGQPRLFITFGTATSTTSTTRTSTTTLTAICSSSSSYQLCGSTG